jgi:hypothetical protein
VDLRDWHGGFGCEPVTGFRGVGFAVCGADDWHDLEGMNHPVVREVLVIDREASPAYSDEADNDSEMMPIVIPG